MISSSEHLLARLAVIERRVADLVAARRAEDPDPDDPYRGLYVADEHVDRMLERPPRRVAASPLAERLLAEVERRADEAEQAGTELRLRLLQRDFGLTDLDVDFLLVAVAPDLDPRFEKLYGYLHDDLTRRRASVGVVLEINGCELADAEARAGLTGTAPLLSTGLLVVEDDTRPVLTRSIRVPDRVVSHLLGDDRPDAELVGVLHDPPGRGVSAPSLGRALVAGVATAYVRDGRGGGAAGLAVAALAQAGRRAVAIDARRMSAGVDPLGLVEAAVREARLRSAGLVLGPLDDLDREVISALSDSGWLVVLYGSRSWDPLWARTTPLVFDAPPVAAPERRTVWEQALTATPVPLERLAPFRLGPDDVRRAVTAGRHHATAAGVALEVDHVVAGARQQNTAGLERLARRVEPAVGWDDLILPTATMEDLRHLASRVARRDQVIDGWGLRRHGARGEGVTALFAGESGTGKTMAAEVLARELGLDLYVINLATVVDKYVGETEKNLERVFDEAEGVNGVLFFDEADALFGKRSEVSDARDRYANIEIAYLLQKMEHFDGLAVLATNLKANLDEAFARRISVVVDFPLPEEEERVRLWEQNLRTVPTLSDLDLDYCAAAFELSGGSIRNVAVTAAFMAAQDEVEVGTPELVRAIQLEYRKLGRLCLEAEFGPYFVHVRTAH